jgi:hypothetical protein
MFGYGSSCHIAKSVTDNGVQATWSYSRLSGKVAHGVTVANTPRQSLNPISERAQGMRITKPACFQPRDSYCAAARVYGPWFTSGPQWGTQAAHRVPGRSGFIEIKEKCR